MSQKFNILIAEDDIAFRETLSLEFRDLGMTVMEIGSIEELDRIPLNGITHALLDLRLGHGNGLFLIQKILALSPQCRIVILTGYGSIATAVKAVKMGAHDYLTKPVRFKEIKDTLLGEKEERSDSDGPSEQGLTLARMEREYIESILHRFEGNISKAARFLGLHRQSLQRKLRKFTPRK